MRLICPNPRTWHNVFQRLALHARTYPCVPPFPPKPLILAGWAYSNDVQKMRRWEETVGWASTNGCADIVQLPDQDFYYVEEPTSYPVGPLGGPMYRPWDFKRKDRPAPKQLAEYLETLKSRWQEIAETELARITSPLVFTGAKARRLLVQADATARPPWGTWTQLSAVESERRTFTFFRASINKAMVSHEVDHVDFALTECAE